MARYNRNPNPAFDNNSNGWRASGTASSTVRVSGNGSYPRPDGRSGNFGDATTNAATGALNTTGDGLAPVVPGQTYVVSAYVYQGTAGAAKNVRMDVDFCNSAGGFVSTAPDSPTVAVPQNTWTRIVHVPVTVPSGCYYISTYLSYAAGAAAYIGVSSAMVEDGASSPNYRDGNYPGWAWTGTAGSSQSRDLDPSANAGPDKAAIAGTTVSLSGSGSNPEGGSVSYAWTVQNAAGTGLTNSNISNRLTANASFTAPNVTGPPKAITLRLTVTDGNGNTGTDDVVVTVSPSSLIEYTGTGGLVLGGSATYAYNRGNDVTGDGGLSVGGAADVLRTLSEVVSGDGGLRAGGSALADLLFITPSFTTGSGGLTAAGTAVPPLFITPTFVTGTGGLKAGGEAVYRYRAASVPAGVTIEWDLDGDGHFSRDEETITNYVMSMESQIGRDYPSQLTGRAGPGKLRLQLLNQDNRFSHFNTDSPLNKNGLSLQVGSRIRVRTIESVNPDATRIAWDSFDRGPASSLGTADSGHVWASTNFDLANHRATAQVGSMGTIDVGSTTHFVQATFGNPGVGFHDGSGNAFGVIYRYVNNSNYGRMQYNVASGRLEVIDRIGGTNTVRSFGYVEPYDGMVLSAYVTGTTVQWYLDGVLFGTTTCGITGGTRCGIYAASLVQHATPWVDDFVVWNKPATTSTGILWTGYVADITEAIELGPRRTVTIDAEGVLAQAAAAEVYPSNSAYGRATGLVVGNTLARAGLLDPPGPIEYGDIVTGAFGYEKESALEVARDFEEAELGFLYETQEGRIGFDHRSARDGRTSKAVFADFEGAQLGYHRLEPRDWRKEIVNRVEAGIAGTAPRGNRNYIWTNYADPPMPLAGVPTNHNGVFWVRPSDANTPITRGQLLIVTIASPRPRVWDGVNGQILDAAVFWEPIGWTVLDGEPTYQGDQKPGAQDTTMQLRVYAKIAEGNENYPIVFGYIRGDLEGDSWYGEPYDQTLRVPYVVSMYNVDNFFGDIKEGVKVSEIPMYRTGSDVTGATPPTVFPDWGPEHPSLFITALSVTPNGIQPKITVPTIYPPDGYYQQQDVPVYRTRNGGSTSANGAYVYLNWAESYGSRGVESPARWRMSTPIPSDLHLITQVTIAVRGKNGDPPIKNGHDVVTRDDVASQRKYKMIRTHREESNLFMGTPDAEEYGDLVLDRYGYERPIMALSYWANTTIAHRTQAITRRVGDRITVESDNATGMNYSGDYFIESINHVITSGGKQWEVTYELSPAT